MSATSGAHNRVRHGIVAPLDRIPLRFEQIAGLQSHRDGQGGVPLAVGHEYRGGIIGRGTFCAESAFSRQVTG